MVDPLGVVTMIGLAPAVPVGVVAVIVVAFTTTTLVASRPSTVTPVAPIKFVPVIVMAVVLSTEPKVGVAPVIDGDGNLRKPTSLALARLTPGSVFDLTK